MGTASGRTRGSGGGDSTGGTASSVGKVSAGATTNSETGFTTGFEIVGSASGTLTFSGLLGVDATADEIASVLSGVAIDAAEGTEGLSGSIFVGVAAFVERVFAFVAFAPLFFIGGAVVALLLTRACNEALKPPNICDARLGPPPVESPNKITNNTCRSIDKITNLPTST